METETTIDIEALPITIRYVGETTRDDKWQCDQWAVTFTKGRETWTTDYFTGLGHRSKPLLSYQTARPVEPDKAGILHSLIMDSDAENENFNDWAENYGYSADSIKALGIYQVCIENGKNLRKFLGRDVVKQLAVQLQDY
jgi:hypothetical protein